MKIRFVILAFAVCVWPAFATAQTVVCSPKEFRPSLVRIDRPGGIQGTGVVIIRRDSYAVILTVKHVMPRAQDFSIVFQAAPANPVRVRWTPEMVLAEPLDSDLMAFRIDAPIPKTVRPEDPFRPAVPEGGTMVMWGYPSATGATLCSYEAPLRMADSGHLTIPSYVPEGVSGGPAFFIDPASKSPKLAGIVVRGTGTPGAGTTDAIDIRQAVPIVTTSKDPRNGNKPHFWPDIQLLDEFAGYGLVSFRHVKSGSFTMGADHVGGQTTRTLPSFYMAKYEVTRGQYQECVAAGACKYTPPNVAPRPNEVNLPVAYVSWYEADVFAKWLQQRLQNRQDSDPDLRRLIDAGWKIDLPSEEEWEKAARKDGKGEYPWGDSPTRSDPNRNTGRPRAVDASRCQDCQWGLFDMAGNVREWTRSLKLPYPYKAEDAEKPTDPGPRAIRGGSFREQQNIVLSRQMVRATIREEAPPTTTDQFTGFRVALICKNESTNPCTWQNPD